MSDLKCQSSGVLFCSVVRWRGAAALLHLPAKLQKHTSSRMGWRELWLPVYGALYFHEQTPFVHCCSGSNGNGQLGVGGNADVAEPQVLQACLLLWKRIAFVEPSAST